MCHRICILCTVNGGGSIVALLVPHARNMRKAFFTPTFQSMRIIQTPRETRLSAPWVFVDHPGPGTPQATINTLREKSQRLPWNATREESSKERLPWRDLASAWQSHHGVQLNSSKVSTCFNADEDHGKLNEHHWTIEPHWTWTCIPGILHVTVIKIDRLDPLAIPLWKGHISGASTWVVFFCAALTCGSCEVLPTNKTIRSFLEIHWMAVEHRSDCKSSAAKQKRDAFLIIFLHQRRLFVLGAVLQGAGFRKECCRTLGERFITPMA